MNVILKRTQETFEKDLILMGKNPKVVGEITKRNDTDRRQTYHHVLLGVNWLEDPQTFVPKDDENDLHLSIYRLMLPYASASTVTDYQVTEKGLFTSVSDTHDKTLIQAIVDEKNTLFIVNEEDYDWYYRLLRAGMQLRYLYDNYPIYEKIVQKQNGELVLVSLLDLLFTLDKESQEDFLLAISYAGKYIATLKSIAERILKESSPNEGLSLMTQEQQVEGFIQFSKLIASETNELVSDKTLDAMRESEVYKRVVDDLTNHGFGLSDTQQFNALQAAAYLGMGNKEQKVLYNLSDMGAGKTLMTVESIFLMDLKTIDDFNGRDDAKDIKEKVENFCVPSKNIIAPKLSIKSSWIKTFELFYDVEKVSDDEYKLSFEYKGLRVISSLYVSAFTVKSSTLHVDQSLPEPVAKREYLIIDEVHQLAERTLTRSRFFASKVVPADSYLTFALSGTLSNLTTREWLNYISFMGLPFKDTVLDTNTPAELSRKIKGKRSTLKETIMESASNIDVDQHRTFDDDAFTGEQMDFSFDKKLTNKNEMFHLMYSSKVLQINNEDNDFTLQDTLTDGLFNIGFDFSITDTPNFELFYNLVGTSAVTAQSTQVAEELFGEQKQQHNADVINVESPLNNDDIHLLRVLHQITKDHQVYKSLRIATDINNAILNLNDGLAKKNVYEILAKYADSNTRFLTYLSSLDLDLLEKLQQSNLIKQPKLENTQKFEIVKDILEREKDETHLIVVNDGDAMKKLADALNVECFTKKQLRDPLNYQDMLDELFEKQSVVIVPQMMIKSSLDLVQANRLIQYQLNAEISDIIQTQNRINRIGQTRETKAYYIATDVLQKNIIDLFLDTYKNIRVAHKGIVELFVDMSSQVNVINDYISKAMSQIGENDESTNEKEEPEELIFDDNGLAYLIPLEKNEQTEEKEEASVWMDFTNREKGQASLFSPVDKAFMHQMIPTCDEQTG